MTAQTLKLLAVNPKIWELNLRCFNNNNFIKLKDKTLLGQKRYYKVAMQLTVIGAPPPGRPNGKFFLFSCISLICKILA